MITVSLRPGVLEAKGLDDARLRELNPALVIVHVSAFGEQARTATNRAMTRSPKGSAAPAILPVRAMDHRCVLVDPFQSVIS